MDGVTLEHLEVGAAGRCLDDSSESGDAYLFLPGDTTTLLAVVDGLGHGPEAAVVARATIAALKRHADAPLESLMRRCHGAVLQTRGAAVGLVRFETDATQITWLGVGNVCGMLIRAQGESMVGRTTHLIPGHGVVGAILPRLPSSAHGFRPGDILVLATDGVDPDFDETTVGLGSAAALANRLIERHTMRRDDALAVVVRHRAPR
jgi:negative regulator of sigma-B (phosphoserine phosphatase)